MMLQKIKLSKKLFVKLMDARTKHPQSNNSFAKLFMLGSDGGVCTKAVPLVSDLGRGCPWMPRIDSKKLTKAWISLAMVGLDFAGFAHISSRQELAGTARWPWKLGNWPLRSKKLAMVFFGPRGVVARHRNGGKIQAVKVIAVDY